MSTTDLEFLQDLPTIRVADIKIQTLQTEIPRTDGDGDGCRTPTSEEHKIPVILSCPPAPRKPKRRTVSCKRKLLSEFEFFEIVNRDEVDEFFRSSFEVLGKRRCPCK